jgi:hypothetical protein
MRGWLHALFISAIAFAMPGFGATLKNDALSVTIGINGVERIDLIGQKTVTAPRSAGCCREGLIVGRVMPVSSISESAGTVAVTDRFADRAAKYVWSLDGNDLNESIEIQNQSAAPLGDPIQIGLPTFSFAADAAGLLPTWDIGYISANDSYHPSTWIPLAAQYAYDSTWGLCLHSREYITGQTVFTCSDPFQMHVPRVADVVLYVKDTVPPKGTLRFSVTMRITPQTKGVDLSSLLAGYIRDYQSIVGPLQYDPDDRPLLEFAAIDTSFVTALNPFGYNGPNRRLDLDGGTRLFERMVSPANRVTSGTIFWQPQGINPRGVEYRPDFDVWPGPVHLPNGETSDVQANLPKLIQWYLAHHLRFGLCARPADVIVAANAKADYTVHLDAGDTQRMAELLARFDVTTKLGVNQYYLDSFGTDMNSARMMRQIRARLGRKIPTFSEMTSDLMLPLSGVYTQTEMQFHPDGGTIWYSAEMLRIFRLLQPHCSILMTHITNNSGAPLYSPDQMGQWKLTPMVEDFLAPRYVQYFRTVMDKYQVNGLWK